LLEDYLQAAAERAA